MTVQNRNTAESKVKRLMRNASMVSHFTHLVAKLSLVKPEDRINVDFSTFCGFQVLTFAKQTSLGRAVPLYIAAITYPIENPGSQTQFIIYETKKFLKYIGVAVHLVFDRGFELPYLASSLFFSGTSYSFHYSYEKRQTRPVPAERYTSSKPSLV